tara:strand:+ start:6317 stop:7225 length:909 start_codon:yes stop_codon:yes gene_type:complete
MIILTLSESANQVVSGIPEYVEFSTDVAANIFYTLDGTTPTYESLIALDKVYLPTNGLTLLIKAIAISADSSSEVLMQEYKTDSTKLDGPRNIGEGISVLPYGSTSVNNLSFNSSGEDSQESSTSFVELEMKASLAGDSKETRLPFVNFASTELDSDRFTSSSVNDNAYFDPGAKLIIIDGTTKEKLEGQSVKFINRTYNSFDPTSKFYNERLGQKEPIITGNYVRSFYNPSTQEYVSYYYESLDSRWIESRQKLTNVEVKQSSAGSRGRAGGRFVYRWIESVGISTPTANITSLLGLKSSS